VARRRQWTVEEEKGLPKEEEGQGQGESIYPPVHHQSSMVCSLGVPCRRKWYKMYHLCNTASLNIFDTVKVLNGDLPTVIMVKS
jgi:hypothetical protein